MKIATYQFNDKAGLALVINDRLYEVNSGLSPYFKDMQKLLEGGVQAMAALREFEKKIKENQGSGISIDERRLLAPVPNPSSCRDAYAFRQHVATARRNRGVEMIPEFDQYPIFYFTNHNAITGPFEDVLCMPDHFEKLDYELEVAVVIGKQGRNIVASEADDYIAGYLIMNDMSARTLQMEEMKLNLGPAKGKDFCTVIGPWLVTPDELEDYLVAPPKGHVGNAYNLEMQCTVNGEQLSKGNMRTMDWTFAEIIERCAYGTDIYPGDVIGSGTVGTGCLLELNGTARLNNPNAEPRWLQEGDVVEMSITALGSIRNKMVLDKNTHSILALKKRATA